MPQSWLPSWGGSEREQVKVTSSQDGAAEAPDRLSRVKCWDARDRFFECLDRNNILDSIKENESSQKQCPKELKQFEQNCASSWVHYFKQRRVAEYEKEQLLKRQKADMFSKT